MSVRSALFAVDPYKGFDADKYQVDMQGWGSTHQFFEPVVAATKPKLIFEIGSWKGASAIHMAGLCAKLGFDTEIICVDTWLGSQENFCNPDHVKNSLKTHNGYPTLYYTFLTNVVKSGCSDRITPLPLSSESAAVVLSRLSFKADLIYIDAAHEFEPALRDMQVFWPMLSEHGMMICDDYGYSQVTQAAIEFAASVKRPIYASYGKALIPKQPNVGMTLVLENIFSR